MHCIWEKNLQRKLLYRSDSSHDSGHVEAADAATSTSPLHNRQNNPSGTTTAATTHLYLKRNQRRKTQQQQQLDENFEALSRQVRSERERILKPI